MNSKKSKVFVLPAYVRGGLGAEWPPFKKFKIQKVQLSQVPILQRAYLMLSVLLTGKTVDTDEPKY